MSPVSNRMVPRLLMRIWFSLLASMIVQARRLCVSYKLSEMTYLATHIVPLVKWSGQGSRRLVFISVDSQWIAHVVYFQLEIPILPMLYVKTRSRTIPKNTLIEVVLWRVRYLTNYLAHVFRIPRKRSQGRSTERTSEIQRCPAPWA